MNSRHSNRGTPAITKAALERLYLKYNRREFIHPDPLEFLFRYDNALDCEVVGLVASSLAFGRVAQILKSVGKVLDIMGKSPRAYLERTNHSKMEADFSGFKHRMADERHLVAMLSGMRAAIAKHGSLNACFMRGLGEADADIVPALTALVQALACGPNPLLPDPALGSACKRLNLFLRWMVREDDVDPGGWCSVGTSRLIVPLDTHMAQLGRKMKLTSRNSADLKMAVEITEGFRAFSPEDPVRYDFALTRLGIHPDGSYDELDALLCP